MQINQFLLNTDYDGQKEAESLEMVFAVPAISLPAPIYDPPYKYQDFTAPDGAFFTTATISDSGLPGKTFVGDSASINFSNYRYNISIHRSATNKYRIWCAANGNNGVTVPAHTITARVKFYVASKD